VSRLCRPGLAIIVPSRSHAFFFKLKVFIKE